MEGNDKPCWHCTTARLQQLMDKDRIEDMQGCVSSRWHLKKEMASELQHSKTQTLVHGHNPPHQVASTQAGTWRGKWLATRGAHE